MTEILLVDSMREYILTDKERKIIEQYLDTGLKLNGWNTLMWRLKRILPRLEVDLELLQRFKEKAEVKE